MTSWKLSKEDNSSLIHQTLYRSMIGGLLYLTTSRPYILQVVCMVARCQALSKETHVIAVKIIFRYLKGTMDYELWYPKGKYFTFITYVDDD